MDFVGTLRGPVPQRGDICIPVGVTALGEREAERTRLGWAVQPTEQVTTQSQRLRWVSHEGGLHPHPQLLGAPPGSLQAHPGQGARSDPLQGPERAQVPRQVTTAAGPPR